MDQDRPRRRRRRRHHRRRGEDHISSLPDELLHGILACLGSARAAARTSVLSRRWRRVWSHMPELVFGNGGHDEPPPAAFLDTVDAALALYAAPALDSLAIVLPSAAAGGLGVPVMPVERVAPWLRFAAERVSGELVLHVPTVRMLPRLPLPEAYRKEYESVLELPHCQRAKTIMLRIRHGWRLQLQLQPVCMFMELTSLTILFARMEGGAVTALASTHCPRLRSLRLFLLLVDASDVSICSGSLHSLSFCVWKTQRLEVVTPELRSLFMHGDTVDEARISAPKLAGVVWHGAADRNIHRFDDDVGHRLQLLEISISSVVGTLMQKFDEVDELKLGISIPRETEAYEIFLKETSKLPKCEILTISLPKNQHRLAPVMLHLLRSCSNTKKVSVQLYDYCGCSSRNPCPSSCRCRMEESHRIGDIALNSLEEVEITSHRSSKKELLEFVEQLSRCNATILKKLVINHTLFSAPSRTKEVCEKIRMMWHPKTEVQFYDFSDGARVRFD